MEENIENFSVDVNYDIYKDLRKKDKIRRENLIKKNDDNKDKVSDELKIKEEDKKEEIGKKNQILLKNDDKYSNSESDKLPDYYKNFVKVKFEFGCGWIHKSNVGKILSLQEK